MSWDTSRTKVLIPSAASVQVLIFQGRLTRRSIKIRSTRDERETAKASLSMKPPKLAVICTVLTTTRPGWASSGTGYLPEPSVKEPGPAGTKYSRLIQTQTPLLAGQLNVASCTMSLLLRLGQSIDMYFLLALNLCQACCIIAATLTLRQGRE